MKHLERLLATTLFTASIASLTSAGAASLNVGIVITGEQTSASTERARYTCGAAQRKISFAGYSDVEELQCSGAVYYFTASTDIGNTKVGIDAYSGEILTFVVVP